MEKQETKQLDNYKELKSFQEYNEFFEDALFLKEGINFIVCFVSSKSCGRCKIFMEKLFIPHCNQYNIHNVQFCKFDISIIEDDFEEFPFDQIKGFPSILVFKRINLSDKKLDYVIDDSYDRNKIQYHSLFDFCKLEFVCKPQEQLASTFESICKDNFKIISIENSQTEIQIPEKRSIEENSNLLDSKSESKKVKLNQ